MEIIGDIIPRALAGLMLGGFGGDGGSNFVLLLDPSVQLGATKTESATETEVGHLTVCTFVVEGPDGVAQVFGRLVGRQVSACIFLVVH
jgi:hypothetical protein